MNQLTSILQEIQVVGNSTFQKFKNFVLNEIVTPGSGYRDGMREIVEESKTFDDLYNNINHGGMDHVVGDWCIRFLKKYYNLK